MALGLIALFLFVLSFFSYGMLFLRFLKWTPLEKFASSFGLSTFIIYLMAFSIYNTNAEKTWYFVIPVGGLVALAVSWKEIKATFQDKSVRGAALSLSLVVMWVLCILGLIRNYGAADWALDWAEHYRRCQVFLEHRPINEKILDYSFLTDRPPVMNLCCGAVMACVGQSFAIFQTVFTLLNCLVFVSAILLIKEFSTNGASRHVLLACLLMGSPSFVVNATYPWTKLLAAYYVLLSLYLYLVGWRRESGTYVQAAFMALSAGFLVHYSAGPYIVLLAVHYLAVLFWKRKNRLTEISLIVLVNVLVLSTWLGWATLQIGGEKAFGSNTAVADARKYTLSENVDKISKNIGYSVIPHFLRATNHEFISQDNPWGYWRDYSFLFFLTNVFLMLGSTGWLLVLVALRSDWKAGASRLPASRVFWAGWILMAVVLGIAVHGDLNSFGLAHICLQPLMVLGIAYQATRVESMQYFWKAVFLLGILIDLSWVAVHVYLQSIPLKIYHVGETKFAIDESDQLGRMVYDNFFMKFKMKAIFLGDYLDGARMGLALLLLLLGCLAVHAVYRDCRRSAEGE